MTDERLRLSPVSGGEAKTAFGGCDKSARMSISESMSALGPRHAIA